MESELVSNSLSESGGEDRSEKTELSPFTYTNIFYKALPYYLAIGMTPDEFWKGDCTLTLSYKEAFDIKRELKNEELWLQGMYNYEGLVDVLPCIVSLGKTKPLQFPKEPYPITKNEIEKQKERSLKEKYFSLKNKTKHLFSAVNEKFNKKEEKSGRSN